MRNPLPHSVGPSPMPPKSLPSPPKTHTTLVFVCLISLATMPNNLSSPRRTLANAQKSTLSPWGWTQRTRRQMQYIVNDVHCNKVANSAGLLQQYGLPPSSDVFFVIVVVDVVDVIDFRLCTGLGWSSPLPPQAAAQWQQGWWESEGRSNEEGNDNGNKGDEQQKRQWQWW